MAGCSRSFAISFRFVVLALRPPVTKAAHIMSLDRRVMIQAGLAALTTGGSFMSSALKRAFAQSLQSIDPGRAFTDRQVDAFSPARRALVAAICETIIPRTDTPGAIEAKVPKFIELLYAHWMNEAEKAVFDEGLAALGGFTELSPRKQQKELEQMEEATDHPWFELGGVSFLQGSTETPPFIILIKEFTVTGYFMSEIGASEVLELNPMGEFDGDIKLARGASAWAAKPLM